LEPGPIREFRLDLTTRCNLRCVYCAVSQPWYQGQDMAPGVLKKAVPALAQIAAYNNMGTVSVNGHGETTIVEGWTEVVTALIDAGLPVGLTTNLAKDFTEEELQVLGRISTIAVSVDTCDRELLRRMRRRVDIRQIVTNINRIRAAALDRLPHFHFLSGLYDQNSLRLEEFARFAVALGIESMNFWQMSKYDLDGAKIPEADRPLPLDELPDDRLPPYIVCIDRAFAILRKHGVGVYVHGDHISRIAARVGMHV